MTLSAQQHDGPFLIRRQIQEAAFNALKIEPREVIGNKFGQRWQADDGHGDGPSFVLQWFGDNHEYFDQQQVARALTDIADWRARNPKRPH